MIPWRAPPAGLGRWSRAFHDLVGFRGMRCPSAGPDWCVAISCSRAAASLCSNNADVPLPLPAPGINNSEVPALLPQQQQRDNADVETPPPTTATGQRRCGGPRLTAAVGQRCPAPPPRPEPDNPSGSFIREIRQIGLSAHPRSRARRSAIVTCRSGPVAGRRSGETSPHAARKPSMIRGKRPEMPDLLRRLAVGQSSSRKVTPTAKAGHPIQVQGAPSYIAIRT